MRKLVILLLVLASCRTGRMSNAVVHDTLVVEQAAAARIEARDSMAMARSSETVIEQSSLDTAGRVRTMTRIITRTVTGARRGTTVAATVRDTVFLMRQSTAAARNTVPPSSARSPLLPAIVLVVILVLVLAMKAHRE